MESVSVKFAPVSATTLGLLSVNVMVLVWPARIVAGANALAMVAASAVTIRLAVLDALPTLVWVVVTPLLVLGLVPVVVAVTEISVVQLPDSNVGTVRFKLVAPTTSAGVLLTPAQLPPIAALVTLTPAGKVSVKLALFSAVLLGLLSVKRSVVMSLSEMVLGVKDIAMLGLVTTVTLVASLSGPCDTAAALTPAATLVKVPTDAVVTRTLI